MVKFCFLKQSALAEPLSAKPFFFWGGLGSGAGIWELSVPWAAFTVLDNAVLATAPVYQVFTTERAPGLRAHTLRCTRLPEYHVAAGVEEQRSPQGAPVCVCVIRTLTL